MQMLKGAPAGRYLTPSAGEYFSGMPLCFEACHGIFPTCVGLPLGWTDKSATVSPEALGRLYPWTRSIAEARRFHGAVEAFHRI